MVADADLENCRLFQFLSPCCHKVKLILHGVRLLDNDDDEDVDDYDDDEYVDDKDDVDDMMKMMMMMMLMIW